MLSLIVLKRTQKHSIGILVEQVFLQQQSHQAKSNKFLYYGILINTLIVWESVMKIKQITETTTAGAIATTETALGGTQSRGNPSIYGGKKVGSLFKGKKTKAPYANSINESAELSEAQLEEDDIIVVPGQGRSRKNGLVPHGQSRIDHEVEMARSDLFSAAKNAQQVYSMIKDVGEDEGLDGWVQEKIIKANDYLNTIREYLEGKQVQSVTEGAEIMYAEELAEKLFDRSPNLQNEDDILTRGFQLSKKDPRIGSRVNAIFRTEDFPSDFVSYYRYIQHNHGISSGMNEGENRVDTLVTDTEAVMREFKIDALPALKIVLGEREYKDRPGYYNTFIRQIIARSKQQGLAEGAKVDRMVKHVAQSEKKLGKSKDEAENIAWATANKRGMLNNKNKKA
jgi:hypothetical protein